MKYTGTLIAVSDMERSKQFYQEVLGLKVIADFGANVTLEGGLFLQTLETWKEFIRTDQVAFQSNACELYFEEREFDGFLEHLKAFDLSYVHEPLMHSWGQRDVRRRNRCPDGCAGRLYKNVLTALKGKNFL